MPQGSDCGSVGRGIASNSSHQQDFIMRTFIVSYSKDENKEKEGGNGPN